MYLCLKDTFSSHGQRTLFRYRRQDPGVISKVEVGLPVQISILAVVGRKAWNNVGSDF